MFSEDDLLPLSALQHLLFCERRCALVLVEAEWADNRYTVEGTHMHRRADGNERRVEQRGGVRIVRGLYVRSHRLGLTGRADVVEFHRTKDPAGAALPGIQGRWIPFPVEYKRGRRRRERGYEVQLCAQAICLEEMLAVSVPSGAIYYGKTKRRLDVAFDPDLRQETRNAAARVHELFEARMTPPAVREPKCERCSLIEICLPDHAGRGRSVASYLNEALR